MITEVPYGRGGLQHDGNGNRINQIVYDRQCINWLMYNGTTIRTIGGLFGDYCYHWRLLTAMDYWQVLDDYWYQWATMRYHRNYRPMIGWLFHRGWDYQGATWGHQLAYILRRMIWRRQAHDMWSTWGIHWKAWERETERLHLLRHGLLRAYECSQEQMGQVDYSLLEMGTESNTCSIVIDEEIDWLHIKQWLPKSHMGQVGYSLTEMGTESNS